jgi:hypothetical protein
VAKRLSEPASASSFRRSHETLVAYLWRFYVAVHGQAKRSIMCALAALATLVTFS